MHKKTALTDCPDPMVPVHKCKAHYRVEQKRYTDGQRSPPPTFKLTNSPTWLEIYLASGCNKKPDGSKWSFDEIDDEALFAM